MPDEIYRGPFEHDEKPAKMGYEQRRPAQSYGTSGWVAVAGRQCWTQSAAERDWLSELEKCITAGLIDEWEWQPKDVAIPYRYAKGMRERTYRPDARVVWNERSGQPGEFWYEIKHGRIEQKGGTNIRRFCEAYPDRKMVIVWKGPAPKRGPTKRQWDLIQPWIDHVWYIRK